MTNKIKFGLSAIVLLPLGAFLISGCSNDAPEVDSSQYGTVVSTLPALPERKESFALPAEVEDADCRVAQRAVRQQQPTP